MSAMEQDSRPPISTRTSSSGNKPKGILKNSMSQDADPAGSKSLNWNEENLAINELSKDSTMKITEPKTPYVRYNAETDQVMDLDKIPGFELGQTDMGVGGGSSSREESVPSSPSSRGTGGGGGGNSRRGSEASEKMVKVEAPEEGSGLDSDEEEDQDPETMAHRRKFAEMRKGHYGNEAEALKRAQALMDEEDNSSGPDSPAGGRKIPPLPTATKMNGVE